MYGIFIVTYIWLIFMVNVGKYIIHGSYGYIRRLYIFLGNFYFLQKHLAISILKKTAKLASRLGDLHKWKNTPIFFRGSQWMSWSFFLRRKVVHFRKGKKVKNQQKTNPSSIVQLPNSSGLVVFSCWGFWRTLRWMECVVVLMACWPLGAPAQLWFESIRMVTSQHHFCNIRMVVKLAFLKGAWKATGAKKLRKPFEWWCFFFFAEAQWFEAEYLLYQICWY